MAGPQGSDIAQILIVGTMGMVILAMGVIVFFFVYQRKILAKESEMNRQSLEHQKMLVDAIIRTKELEKRRIALELHDDVGSTLTALKFAIPGLKIPSSEQDRLAGHLQSAIQKVRRISNELLPSILEELGLESAIRNLVAQLNEHPGIVFTYKFSGEKGIAYGKDVELAFYRVLQELLNNIQKYAGATTVLVELEFAADGAGLVVTDNGSGFSPEDHTGKDTPSLGLRNMESRIQHINGRMNYTRLDKGTKVTITWNREQNQ